MEGETAEERDARLAKNADRQRRRDAEAAIVIGQNKACIVLLGGPKHQER